MGRKTLSDLRDLLQATPYLTHLTLRDVHNPSNGLTGQLVRSVIGFINLTKVDTPTSGGGATSTFMLYHLEHLEISTTKDRNYTLDPETLSLTMGRIYSDPEPDDMDVDALLVQDAESRGPPPEPDVNPTTRATTDRPAPAVPTPNTFRPKPAGSPAAPAAPALTNTVHPTAISQTAGSSTSRRSTARPIQPTSNTLAVAGNKQPFILQSQQY
ncbi:hypothetical protein D9758_011198 [Tetrapyrgos nigripes]|uniref:Uncharacterized protein n=1 Tax=Tetrapyrgos nigripes TaxID=182062 RepID=A0A8H5D7B0_9AGAR|nr:hypothetical protein D9758_011198 [Tetrapyrgos nigripes]